MGDHLVLSVDTLVAPASLQSSYGAEAEKSLNEGSSSKISYLPATAVHVNDVGERDTLEGEEEHLIQGVECRICQEEDSLQNLDTPCACGGTLKFAHRRCVQLWCNEKGDTICEICHQLMALLLLRHVAPLFNADVVKALTYFSQAAAELAFMLQAEQQQG